MSDNDKWAHGPKALLRALTVAVLATCAAGAWAADTPAPARSAEAACLQKPTEALKYPERSKERRYSGSLKARLIFTRPDDSPKIEILSWSGSSELADAAEVYLQGYRLPCLPAGGSVSLDQEVVFTASSSEDDAAARDEDDVWSCLRTPGPFSFEEDMQTGRLIKQKTTGTLLLRLTFDAPDAPPRIERIYNSTPSMFSLAAERHAQAYRLPCLKPDGGPVKMRQAFRFNSFARSHDLVLKDVGLVELLRSIKDVDKVPVKFDLGTMSCPFKLRWRLYQPADRNIVTEIGARVPQRRAFMEWLSTLSLNMGTEQTETLFGAEAIITVPCGTIEL